MSDRPATLKSFLKLVSGSHDGAASTVFVRIVELVCKIAARCAGEVLKLTTVRLAFKMIAREAVE